jgi:hypothetical protein
VSQEAGKALAAELGIPFLECSSKEGHNVCTLPASSLVLLLFATLSCLVP